MSLLTISNLTQGFGDKILYENAGFELYKGEHIGVVGQNGTGKSTLVKILAGEVVPDQGEIKWQPRVGIGYLDQESSIKSDATMLDYFKTAFSGFYDMERTMAALYEECAVSHDEGKLQKAAAIQERLLAAGFYDIDTKISRVAFGLGLDAIGTERRVSELSGGQRAKVILAKLLLDTPDVLLLDEPTNFLDAEHIAWLSDFLNVFAGTFLVVSHDHAFLERIATGILDIEFCEIRKYHGKYSDFLAQKKHLRENYIRQYEAQRLLIDKTEAYIRKNKAGVNSKIARGRQKQLDRVERIAPPEFAQKPVIRFSPLSLPAQKALEAAALEIGYCFPLLPALNFSVFGGQKLVVTGFNGIGKSTLLKTLTGGIPALGGSFAFSAQVRIGYYAQDLLWENAQSTPLQILANAYPKLSRKELRRRLALSGVKNEHAEQAIGTLSGGEQAKVKLCVLMMTPCNFLILDEPTSHLDAETKEALKTALQAFPGSVLLVTHEKAFYGDWIDKVFNIEKLVK